MRRVRPPARAGRGGRSFSPMATPRTDLATGLVPAWLAGYTRLTARDDVAAGTTLAAYAVPSSIAYAQLAGMPVQTGLYCYLYAGIAYALIGTSRQLAVGPTSSIALTLAVSLGALAAGDPARYAELASATAFFTGLIALFAAAMRWGGVVHFISETVLTGFKIGAGIVIAMSTLPQLLGIKAVHGDLWRVALSIVSQLPSLHVPSLVFGVAAFAALEIGHALRPRWPIPIVVVAVSLALMAIPQAQSLGIATVGAFPAGIPWPSLPDLHWTELDTLLPLSLACFFLAYNEGVAAARLLALRHEYSIDPNRELGGLAAASIAIAVGQDSRPRAASRNRSSTTRRARGRRCRSSCARRGWPSCCSSSRGSSTACRSRSSRRSCSPPCKACSRSTSFASSSA